MAPPQKPMKKSDKKQTKPSRPDVRNEHRAIIVTRLGEIVEIAFGASLEHIKGPSEGPTPCLEHFTFMTTRAFEMENAVPL